MEQQSQAPKPSSFTPRSDRWRLRSIAVVLLIGFSLILGRLFIIQIIHGKEYQERARKQYEAKVELRAERGKITDRAGRVIATTVQSASFAIDPKMVEQKERICRIIAGLSGYSEQSLLQKIANNSERNFVWLARGVDIQHTALLDSIRDIGFIRLAEPRRNYVYGSMAAHIVGATDVDNRGLSGIELTYDSLLRGASGFALMQRDGRGKMRPGVNNIIQSVRNGNTVQLTIDAELQGIVEYELQQGIEGAKATSGTAIAINPTTGEILAMASYPTFNPNAVSTSNAEAMRLRAITDMYEPGSTFKLVTAAAALEEKVVSPETIVDGMNGEMRLNDGTIIRDHEPLGTCSLTQALEKSSNIVFANVAQKISSDKFYKYTRDFGFGIPIGFELPGEARGLLKKPEEYDRTTKLYMGHGYELAATALQTANAYATVANMGIMMKPYIVKALLDENGRVLQEFEPQKIRRVISEQTAKTLTTMFCSVVENGTGKEARVKGLSIAGKTGTAQQLVDGKYSKSAYTASFAGFFPAESPRFVLLVMLDKPQTDIYGGTTAAPIFRRIVQRIVMSPALASSLPTLAELGETLLHSDTVAVPDVRGLEKDAAVAMLHQFGLRLKSNQNSGIVATQAVAPGTGIERGSEIEVSLRPKISPDSTQQHPSVEANPDVRGFTLRRAIALLHSAGIEVRIVGSGKVVRQTWSKKGNQRICTLECR